LSGSLLERLNSIQLTTFSHQEPKPTEDKRAWFELLLTRTAHKDGDRIQVHVAAGHGNVKNHYQKGKLVYGIGYRDNKESVLHNLLEGSMEKPGPAQAEKTPTEFLISDGLEVDVINERKADEPDSQVIVGKMKWGEKGDMERNLRTWEGLASKAQEAKRHVLLVFDAEELPGSEEKDRRLSWDQTVENIWNHALQALCSKIGSQNKYFHLLIPLGFEGAIYKGFQATDTKAHLIYEPTSAKGSFLRSYSDKDVDNTKDPDTTEEITTDKLREQLREQLKAAWVAGLVASLAEGSVDCIENLGIRQARDAMMTGIRWSRRFAAIKFPKGKPRGTDPVFHRMKFETVSEPVLVSVELDLVSKAEDTDEKAFKQPLVLDSLPCPPEKAAWDTLKHGFGCVLPYMPSAQFGNLVTADRGEVDGFRTIANTVDSWYQDKTNKTPLPIAVFGQPGSGKSFGVKEVIKATLAAHQKEITDLEFNLSQFRKEDDLRQAFQAIQDKGLSGKVPIVFFDEFDSTFRGRSLGWLKHFIKPITEGKYMDGEVTRPLGRGIYIFIGGTKTTYGDFFKDIKPISSSAHAIPPGQGQTPETKLKEFLGDIDGKQNFNTIELDLSEMTEYNQLKKRFYEIRDQALEGNLPLVFFKNFDSNFGAEKLGWLKYFLAPMQDGEFFDHGSRHPIGRAIFVFDQGTPHFNGFPETNLNYEAFPGAKLPDFVSRLRGHVQKKQTGNDYEPLKNVATWYLQKNKADKPLSIGLFHHCAENPQLMRDFKGALKGYVNILGPNKLNENDGKYFPIRRAILLRSMFERGFKVRDELQIKEEVQNALLFTPNVLHGARSLEAILAMSQISPSAQFEEGHLPSVDQRKLHVDQTEFGKYLKGPDRNTWGSSNANDKHRYAWIERKSGRAYKVEPSS
ncbi:hypothetical protein ASPWEDRAFT_733487, partial [Aspergillus wentii DTO 134E9]